MDDEIGGEAGGAAVARAAHAEAVAVRLDCLDRGLVVQRDAEPARLLDQPADEILVEGGQEPRSLLRSEEHTSELQSLMRISYAVFCLKKKKNHNRTDNDHKIET